MRALLAAILLVFMGACHGAREPSHRSAAHPLRLRIGVDIGHGDYHTIDDRYAPFAAVLSAAGFDVRAVDGPFDRPGCFDGIDILVISNATGSDENEAALTEAEADAVKRWLEAGGSLWLIADHFPFGGAVKPLARVLGVEMSNGMVGDEEHYWSGADDAGNVEYTTATGLADHPITRGLTPSERVTTVVTFVGQSLRGPAGSHSILRLSPSAREMLPPDRHIESAAGRSQGLAFEIGRGRVYVAAEAAMFTEQQKPDGTPMGMNAPGNDDRQFTINVARWLGRQL